MTVWPPLTSRPGRVLARGEGDVSMSDLANPLGQPDRHVSTRQVLRWLEPNPNLPDGPPKYVAELFADAAVALLGHVPSDSPELTVALRKMLEAKDAAVRAALAEGD